MNNPNINEKFKPTPETGWDGLAALANQQSKSPESARPAQETASDDHPSREQSIADARETALQAYDIRNGEQATKPVDELSPADAASEYLDLLAELGRTFTGPEAKSGQLTYKDGTTSSRGYSGGHTADFVRIATGKKRSERLTDDDMPETPALTLDIADHLIADEIKWSQAGEEYSATKAKLDKAQAAYKKKNPIARLFAFGARREIQTAELRLAGLNDTMRRANTNLARNLSWAYDPNSYYGHHIDNQGRNEEYNQRFFVANQAKIDRAKALRQALAANNKNL